MFGELWIWFCSLPGWIQAVSWVFGYLGIAGIFWKLFKSSGEWNEENNIGMGLFWPVVLVIGVIAGIGWVGMSLPGWLFSAMEFLFEFIRKSGPPALDWLRKKFWSRKSGTQPATSAQDQLVHLRSFYLQESALDEERLMTLGSELYDALGKLQDAEDKGKAMLVEKPNDTFIASIVALLEQKIKTTSDRVSEMYLAAQSIADDRKNLGEELDRLTYCRQVADLLEGEEARKMEDLHRTALEQALAIKKSCANTIARAAELQKTDAASINVDPRIIGKELDRQAQIVENLWDKEIAARLDQVDENPPEHDPEPVLEPQLKIAQ